MAWLHREREDWLLRRFLRAPEGPSGRAAHASRLFLVDSPPGYGAGTLLSAVPAIAARFGWKVVRVRSRLAGGVSSLGRAPGDVLGRELLRVGEGRESSTTAKLERLVLDQARRSPTVLVVDDLHLVSPAQRRALLALISRGANLPLLAVARAWSGTRHQGLVHLHWLVDYGIAAETLRPGPIPVAVVRAELDGLVRRGFPITLTLSTFAEQLVMRGGGVPAVVAAVLRMLERSRGAPVGLWWPTVAKFVVTARRDYESAVVHALPVAAAKLALGLALTEGSLPTDVVTSVVDLGPSRGRGALAVLSSAGLLAKPPGAAAALRENCLARRVIAVADPEVRANVTARAAETAHRHGVCDEIVGSLLTRARSPRYPPWAYPVIHRAALSQSRRGRHDIARPQIVHALDAHRDRTDCGRALRLAEAAVPTPDCPHLAERNLAELVRYAETAELRVRAADQLVLRCSTGFVRGVLARAHSRSDIADEERWAIQALYWALRPDSVPVHLDEPLVSALPRLPADAARAGIVALATAVRGGPRTLARVRALARLALGPEGDRGATVAARLFACRALLLTEATDEAEAALSALLTESRTQESATLQAATQIALAELEGRRGRVGRAAVALNAAACALPDWAWQNRLFSLGVAAPAHLALLRGDFELAARCLAEAPSIASEPCWPWWDHDYLRGCHALVTGRWRESAKLLRRCGRRLAARGCLNPAVVPWRSMAALALAASGEIESARELARREVHLAREWSAPGALGWALVVLGALEGSGAAASTDEGIGLLRLSPLRSDLALGLTLIAVMARDAAPNALWEAAKLCDEIGALPGAARLRDLARASHGG